MKYYIDKYTNQFLLILVFIYLSFSYLSYAYSNIVLVCLSGLYIILLIYNKEKFQPFQGYFKRYILVIVPIVLTILSVLLSQNKLFGLSHFWHKIPVLIVPFILFSLVQSKKQIEKVSIIFILLSAIAFLFTFYKLIELNPTFLNLNTELSKQATIIQHPYFGVYQLLALIFLVEFHRTNMHKFLFYLLLFIFSLGVLISTSRISYILYMIIALIYISKLFSLRNAVFLLLAISVFFITLIRTNDAVQQKFSRSITFETSPRLILWKNAYLVLKNAKNPILGVTTDYYDEGVKDPYWLKGYIENSKDDYVGLKGYSSHNQYFEFLLLNGIIGSLYLLLILYVLIKTLKNKDAFLISLIVIIGLFSFTESILHRQHGIILYAVLMPMIFGLLKLEKKRS